MTNGACWMGCARWPWSSGRVLSVQAAALRLLWACFFQLYLVRALVLASQWLPPPVSIPGFSTPIILKIPENQILPWCEWWQRGRRSSERPAEPASCRLTWSIFPLLPAQLPPFLIHHPCFRTSQFLRGGCIILV